MFCSQCGNQLEPGNNFCTKCGFKLDSIEKINSSERLNDDLKEKPVEDLSNPTIWVFQAQRKFSMLKIFPCNIVFTKDNIVLAHITPALQKLESAKAAKQIKDAKVGFFKGSSEMMRYWADFSDRYYKMSLEEILAEEATNQIINRGDILTALFKGYSDEEDSDSEGKLQLSLVNGETIKLTHRQSSNSDIKEFFTSYFGERLKYKK